MKTMHQLKTLTSCRFIRTLFLLLIMISLTACAGAGDWKIDNLPGSFEIWSINGKTIKLVLANENNVSASTVVPTYVFEVAYTDEYIFAKQADVNEYGIDYSAVHYYIVDVDTAESFGPYDEQTFSENIKTFGIAPPIEWMDLKTLRKTPYQSQSGT